MVYSLWAFAVILQFVALLFAVSGEYRSDTKGYGVLLGVVLPQWR